MTPSSGEPTKDELTAGSTSIPEGQLRHNQSTIDHSYSILGRNLVGFILDSLQFIFVKSLTQ